MCNLPISVLIVGVGDCEFEKMEVLDGDDGRLTSSDGRTKATRDIVQFVPFRDFKNKTPQAFSSELLAENPHQLKSFMKMHNIQPRPRQTSAAPVSAVPVVAVATPAAVIVDMNKGH